MQDGFIQVAAGTLHPVVADVRHNAAEIIDRIREADAAGVQLLVLPELCVTGYTCGDLFYSTVLQTGALTALEEIRAATAGLYPVVAVGLPLLWQHKLYNVAAVLRNGRLLGVVPKRYLPNYAEFYEMRQFTSGDTVPPDAMVALCGQTVPFGSRLLFAHESLPDYCFGVEICEDVWAPCPPADVLCRGGATLMLNLSASNEVVGKEGYRRTLVSSTSARLLCGYVYCSAGPEESTQDLVFSRHHLIAENGTILAENKPFADAPLLVSEIDTARLAAERHRMTSFSPLPAADFRTVVFAQPEREVTLTRPVDANPFVPPDDARVRERAEAIFRIQSYGLKKRLTHAHAKTAVVGISGGLDSCLALLVMARAMDLLERPRTDIVAVTMPCFGTTERTHRNACQMCRCLGVTLREVDISAAVLQHFADIGHDPAVHDVTYENGQARERTQVLMDIANETGGILVGTGDLSELALGWATYNGDHMSMYGVNASVPKTLVRYMVRYEAEHSDPALQAVLEDILDTPVSPELLPAQADGTIAQKTEDLVGPYELHDFFLYYILRFGFAPHKIFRLARYAFRGAYDDATIEKWLRAFLRRFFSQQFKRSCMPDGPKVGSATLSPRGDWRMPSDASGALWLEDLTGIVE